MYLPTIVLVIDVPAPVLNSGNFEVAIFSIVVPERELSEEQYAIEAAAKVA